MPKLKKTRINQTAVILLTVGAILLALSALNASSFLAIIGISTIFWSIILLYLAPTKHVPLTLLQATANNDANNTERILNEANLTEHAIYLPPKNLKNLETSLIFIPTTPNPILPNPEDTNEKLYTQQNNGILLTPPGLKLTQLLEQELGSSFTKTELQNTPKILPKLLTDDMELAEKTQIQIQGNTVTVEITDSIFDPQCQDQTKNQPKTHKQIGCILTSTIACALAKTTGKPITIQNETHNPETKTTTIQYHIEEA